MDVYLTRGKRPAHSAVAILSCLMLVVATSIAAEPIDPSEPYRVREVDGCVNVRPQPNVDSTALACLGSGAEVVVIATEPYWREIILSDGRQGWIAKKFIDPSSTPEVAATSVPIPANAFLDVHFVDVGQGDAIWIHTFDDGIDGNGRFEGYNVVIDGGPYSSDARNPLLPYLEARGHHGAVIDALIVTHPHTDHFRGAETISRHFDVRHYYDPGYPSSLVSYSGFLEAMRGVGDNPRRAEVLHIGASEFGQLNWGSELTVEALYAYDEHLDAMGSGNTLINNASIVLRIEYGEHVFLLMGDAEGKDRDDLPDPPQYVEARLLETAPARLKATVLKIGHHGSETSSTLDFIRAVDPDIVVVQSGRKSFGGTYLPDATTLRRYCDHDPAVQIYRTDQNDALDGLSESEAADGDHIVIRSNGAGTPIVEAFEGGEPFQGGGCGG